MWRVVIRKRVSSHELIIILPLITTRHMDKLWSMLCLLVWHKNYSFTSSACTDFERIKLTSQKEKTEQDQIILALFWILWLFKVENFYPGYLILLLDCLVEQFTHFHSFSKYFFLKKLLQKKIISYFKLGFEFFIFYFVEKSLTFRKKFQISNFYWSLLFRRVMTKMRNY